MEFTISEVLAQTCRSGLSPRIAPGTALLQGDFLQ